MGNLNISLPMDNLNIHLNIMDMVLLLHRLNIITDTVDNHKELSLRKDEVVE